MDKQNYVKDLAPGRFLRARRKGGIVLATLLVFISLLVVMVGALFLATRHKLALSRVHHDQVAALYLAELAIRDAMTELEKDPSWQIGFQDKSFPKVKGTYTLEFSSSDRLDKETSVNNYDGSKPASYHGPNSVRPGHALLIATARVGTVTRTAEAFVKIGGGVYPTDVPILNDGYVALRGAVSIDGIKSLREGEKVPGGVHSNLARPDANLVTLRGRTPRISGKVSSSGSSRNAINLNGYNPGLGTETSVIPKPFKEIDILQEIANNSVGLSPPVNPGGTTVLTDAPVYYHPSSLNLQGDLVLDGVALYVRGDLTVNGSITGDGSLFVGGKTKFLGDSRITAGSPAKVALYSEGSVEIAGFDGTSFIESAVSGSPQASADWDRLKRHLSDYQTVINQPGMNLDPGPETTRLGGLGRKIGAGASGAAPGEDMAGAVRDYIIATQGRSSARRKVVQKLNSIHNAFYSEANGSPEAAAALTSAQNGRMVKGSIGAIVDGGRTDLLGMVRSVSNSIDFNSPGSAYFQGLVYTHGFVHASDEITIVGALVARVDSDAIQAPEKIGSNTLYPGDVYLLDGTQVIYVEDFFNPTSGGGAGAKGNCQVALWVR